MIYILGFFPLVPNHTAVMVHTDSRVSPGSTQRLLSNRSTGQVVSGVLTSGVPQAHHPASHLPPRQLQCTSRSTVQGHRDFDRVVHQRRGFRNPSPPSRVRPPDRPVCNGPQHPVQALHVSLSRLSCVGDRRVQPLLGQLEHSVSFPTCSNDFEGFSEAETVSLRPRHLRLPLAGGQALVPRPVFPCSEIVQTISPPATDRPGLPCGPSGTDASDRARFIREFFSTRFPDIPITAELMSLPIRQSSAKIYQSHWHDFMTFLRREGVVSLSHCTLRHAVKFLTLLFTEKGLIASTVAHYRTALSFPLRTVLNIDLLDPAVSAMIRAMSLR